MTQAEMFKMEDYVQEPQKSQHTCRTCAHRERWKCGGRIIQYCGKRRSNRTFNRLLKIKVTKAACELYKEMEE